MNSSLKNYFRVSNYEEDPEKKDLLIILERYHWNRSKVAKELGIGRTTLWRKLKKLNIEKD
jgi:transcriptional regulator of acetoin/glycerol metabolism